MENIRNSNQSSQAGQVSQINQGRQGEDRVQQLINERNRKMDQIKALTEEIRQLDRQITEARRAIAPVEKKQEIA
jgi:prefoldin subunit 5